MVGEPAMGKTEPAFGVICEGGELALSPPFISEVPEEAEEAEAESTYGAKDGGKVPVRLRSAPKTPEVLPALGKLVMSVA